MRQAAALIVSVIQGESLTERWEAALSAHPRWPDQVRGAVRDLAWSTLRDFGRGDLVLNHLVERPLPQEVRALLLVALHRLEVRPDHAYLVVDQAVEAVGAFAPGMKGLVNGVLRNVLRRSAEVSTLMATTPVARYRHPAWWIERVKTSFPEHWESVLEAGNTHPPMSLRPNVRRMSVDDYAQALDAEGLAYVRDVNDALRLPIPMPVSHLPGFDRGEASVQDAGAQFAARLLGVRDGDRVLDACAAPGGKTAHILELADAELLALDISPSRLSRVADNLKRLGLNCATGVGDARKLDDWWDGRPFDRILADVPCSASGVVRRHPDIKWLRRPEDVTGFARQQAAILDALWHTLAPGGTMLYATCSVFDEENRAQIDGFRDRHGDVERLPLHGQMELQLLPNAEHDGFYYALLCKRV